MCRERSTGAADDGTAIRRPGRRSPRGVGYLSGQLLDLGDEPGQRPGGAQPFGCGLVVPPLQSAQLVEGLVADDPGGGEFGVGPEVPCVIGAEADPAERVMPR